MLHNDRKIVSRTHFKRKLSTQNNTASGGVKNHWQWYWHTKANNEKIVADGSEGYDELRGAVGGFWVSQGLKGNPVNFRFSVDKSYSNLEKYADDHYVIIHYAPLTETEEESNA